KFFYSSQTIRSRIQNLARKIQFLDIDVSVDTKVFKGIKLIGREIQKRVLLENFFTSITVKKEMYMDFVIENFSSWISKDIIRYVFKILDNINSSYQLNLDFSMYKKLIAQLVITIHQSKYQLFAEIESKEIERLKQFKEFNIGEDLQADLQKYVKIPNKEMAFLVNYLISMQLNIEESAPENKDKEIVKIIESILRQIENDYNVPIHSKESFKKNIVNHIYRIVYPVSHNLRIYNPFVKETKAQYFFSFSIASSIALQMKKELSLEVQDNEIAYLTYHIQVVLDTQRKKKIKTVILYSRSYEQANLLATKISTYFNELEIVKIDKYHPKYEFDTCYLYIGVNLINFPQSEANIITIQNAFQNDEIKKIRFFIGEQFSIIEQAEINWINVNTIKDAIFSLLTLSNKEHFYDSILKRERISYTSVGDLTAIPHPYSGSEEYKERIIIGINKKPIDWWNELVQLVIIYIPSINVERNEYAFSEFHKKTNYIENVKKLVSTTSKQHFKDVWNEL